MATTLLNLLASLGPEDLVEGTVLGLTRVDGEEFTVTIGKHVPTEQPAHFQIAL